MAMKNTTVSIMPTSTPWNNSDLAQVAFQFVLAALFAAFLGINFFLKEKYDEKQEAASKALIKPSGDVTDRSRLDKQYDDGAINGWRENKRGYGLTGLYTLDQILGNVVVYAMLSCYIWAYPERIQPNGFPEQSRRLILGLSPSWCAALPVEMYICPYKLPRSVRAFAASFSEGIKEGLSI